MKVVVVGIGYVGLSNGVLLAQKNEVIMVDILKEKIDLINKKVSPIRDDEIEKYLKKDIDIFATSDEKYAFSQADIIIIATPTNYDEEKNYFDTSTIEDTLQKIKKTDFKGIIIIKSTIPIGYIEKIKNQYGFDNIIFMPEFLREGKALYDNLYPSRIVVGEKSERAKKIVNLYLDCIPKKDVDVLYTGSNEAETIKLFSNTYLAMRVAFFNELDMYAESNDLNSKEIIEGVCLDPRIGNYYNNPSFGYGGYCLPKDTKQLLVNFGDIPNDIMNAIVCSNVTRKKYIANQVVKRSPKIVGIYRLIMKSDSDNFRQSAIQDIMKMIQKEGIKIIVYEPTINGKTFEGYEVVNDLDKFKIMSNIILVNRKSSDLDDVSNKIYTRDLFSRD